MAAYLVTCRHILHLLTPRPPIIRLQLRVFDPLLTPILMQLADVVLTLLEEEKFVSDALLDKHPPRVLVHDGLFVLEIHISADSAQQASTEQCLPSAQPTPASPAPPASPARSVAGSSILAICAHCSRSVFLDKGCCPWRIDPDDQTNPSLPPTYPSAS